MARLREGWREGLREGGVDRWMERRKEGGRDIGMEGRRSRRTRLCVILSLGKFEQIGVLQSPLLLRLTKVPLVFRDVPLSAFVSVGSAFRESISKGNRVSAGPSGGRRVVLYFRIADVTA